MEKLSLRQKSVLDLIRRVKPLKKFIKQWFYHAGMKFLQANQLTDEEEVFLEKVTDFYVDNLEEIDADVKFLQRAELGPVQLPNKKKKEKVKI
jgi:hypothetical protein